MPTRPQQTAVLVYSAPDPATEPHPWVSHELGHLSCRGDLGPVGGEQPAGSQSHEARDAKYTRQHRAQKQGLELREGEDGSHRALGGGEGKRWSARRT